MTAYLNFNTNLHIDLLKSQYAVFSIVHKRMVKAKRDSAYQLGYELYILKIYLIIRENEKRR